MRIYDAYTDTQIRRGYKKLLIAQGMTVVSADKIYDRFGVYVSRIKSVNFDRLLHSAPTETEFKAKLDYIFKDRWRDHLGYAEIPAHFYAYVDYLHMLVASGTTDEIDGLEIDFSDCPLPSPGRYEQPYIGPEGRLRIIANPALLRQLSVGRASNQPEEELVATCRRFYPFLDSTMADADWGALIVSAFERKGRRTDTSSVRNIAMTLPGGERRVMEGAECFYHAVAMVGPEQLLNATISHMRYRLVVRQVPPQYKRQFRPIGNGMHINLIGTTLDKYKTLRLLDSFYNLGLAPELCNVAARRNRNLQQVIDAATAPAAPADATETEQETVTMSFTDPEPAPEPDPRTPFEVDGRDREHGYGFGNLFSGFE